MSRVTRIALVFAAALALVGGVVPTTTGSAGARDVSTATSYVSGTLQCLSGTMTIVSHASGTVYHRIGGATAAVFHNGTSFEHDSSTTQVGTSHYTWEVESVGGAIFKANARCD